MTIDRMIMSFFGSSQQHESNMIVEASLVFTYAQPSHPNVFYVRQAPVLADRRFRLLPSPCLQVVTGTQQVSNISRAASTKLASFLSQTRWKLSLVEDAARVIIHTMIPAFFSPSSPPATAGARPCRCLPLRVLVCLRNLTLDSFGHASRDSRSHGSRSTWCNGCISPPMHSLTHLRTSAFIDGSRGILDWLHAPHHARHHAHRRTTARATANEYCRPWKPGHQLLEWLQKSDHVRLHAPAQE
jgi:hypothetical protein